MNIGNINTRNSNTAVQQYDKNTSGKEFKGFLSAYNRNSLSTDEYISSPKVKEALPSEWYRRTNSTVVESLLFPPEDEEGEETVKDEKQDSETNNDIMVRPDGSRVLVVTIKAGSFESTMSVEISKPTEFINGEKSLSEEKTISTNDSLGEIEGGIVN